MLTVGSLFSGIGGLDLGLERAGMKVIWNCEIDPYACGVLKKHWPQIPNLGNIKEINWNDVPRPDVLCGGYPCQPFSTAGQRQGEEDPRHLFPWVAEAIRQLRPRYAVMENVSGHLSLGFGTVQGLLAEIGYDSRWDCVPAAAVGAPHLRDRVFIIATPRAKQRQSLAKGNNAGSCDPLFAGWDAPWHGRPFMANTDNNSGQLQPEWEISEPDIERCGSSLANSGNGETGWRLGGSTETQRHDGDWTIDERRVSEHDSREWWPAEPNVGRVAHGIPRRLDRLRGLGNAVVPQVAEHIGRIVIAHDALC